MAISVSSHEFQALRFWDRWWQNGRCRVCFCGRDVHPTGGPARSIRDRSPAMLRFPAYRSPSH